MSLKSSILSPFGDVNLTASRIGPVGNVYHWIAHPATPAKLKVGW